MIDNDEVFIVFIHWIWYSGKFYFQKLNIVQSQANYNVSTWRQHRSTFAEALQR